MKKKKNIVKISLNLKDYPLEAIYGASYVFLDRAYLFLNSRGSDKIEVSLESKTKTSEKQLNGLKGEFLNELLSYALRANVAKKNRKIREFIVGQALMAAIGDDFGVAEESAESESDPLGIAMPWEEKYGKDAAKAKSKKTKK